MSDLFSMHHPSHLSRALKRQASFPEDRLPDLAGFPLEAITGEREIANMLRSLAKARRTVRLSSLHVSNHVRTRLLNVGRHEFVICQAGDPTSHAAILQDRHINLLSRDGETPLMGSFDLLGCDMHEGTPCYVANLPTILLVSEMRASFRVPVAEARDLRLDYAHPAGEQLVTRVSEGGLGLVLPHRPLCGIAPDDSWPKARFGGSEDEIGVLDLKLRRFVPMASGERSSA